MSHILTSSTRNFLLFRRLVHNLGIFESGVIKTNPESNADLTHFDVFELDPTFDLDARKLTKKFREIQSILHPDKFAKSGQEQLKMAEGWSTRVNEAYQG